MKSRTAVYWTTTIIVALAFLPGGVMYLLGVDATVQGVTALGYPAYFVTLLGLWKILGGIAILAPRFPRLKEWAYAGIAFDLTGAAVSIVAADLPAAQAIVPLLLLGITAASWALRPADRTLGAPASLDGTRRPHDEPAPARS